jgi:hypothetical protein
MSNGDYNVNFFSFDKLMYKFLNTSFNVPFDVDNVNDISAICSYVLIYETILNTKPQKNSKTKNL